MQRMLEVLADAVEPGLLAKARSSSDSGAEGVRFAESMVRFFELPRQGGDPFAVSLGLCAVRLRHDFLHDGDKD